MLVFQMIVLGTALAPGPLLLWPWLYRRYRSRIEPAPVTAELPTPNLGDEPPAVVNLLVHQDPVSVDAAEATLLDLASRRIVELWAPDGSGPHTVVRLRQSRPVGLTDYESLVLERIRQRATGDLVPLTALAFKDRKDARGFLRGFARYVAAAAAARGLVEPNRRAHMLHWLVPAVVEVAWIAGLALVIPGLYFFTVPIVAFTLCAWGWMRHAMWELHPRWQLTAAGRARAAHWLGVRDWLRGFPTFADLPPAAVALWDRYLAYGAALDATPGTSATIDLGYDWRRRLWSAYGGQWRRVTVRTRTWAAIRLALLQPGALVPALVVGAVLFLPAPILLVVLPFGDRLLRAAYLLPHPFLAYPAVVLPVAGYLIVRRTVDKARAVPVAGVVVHIRYVGQRFFAAVGTAPRALVIDDGTGDRLTEWLLLDDGIRLYPGYLVRGTAGRWYRRLKRFEFRPPPGPAARRPPAPVSAPPARVAEPAPVRDGAWIAHALPEAELSATLGVPVRAVTAGPAVTFVSTVDGHPVLRLEVRDRTTDPDSWAARPVGWALPGLADEAYCGPGWAVARTGSRVVLVDGWPPSFPHAPAEALRLLMSRWPHPADAPVTG